MNLLQKLGLIVFIPSLYTKEKRGQHDEARLKLLLRRVWHEIVNLHSDWVDQPNKLQVLFSNDTASKLTKEILLSELPNLQRTESFGGVSSCPLLQVERKDDFKLEILQRWLHDETKVLFMIRPNDDLFFFSKTTGILETSTTGKASLFYVEENLLKELEP